MDQLTLVKTDSSRRRKLKLRRVKYTLQARDGTVAAAYGGGEVESGVAPVAVSYGAVSVIGRRKEMEDAVRAELGFAKIKKGGQNGNLVGWYDFFGVYDGHGGARVAEACRRKMHEMIASEMTKISSSSSLETNNNNNNKVVGCGYWEEVMEGGFERMDEEVREERNVGSTAVVVVVGAEEVVVANCGDCRAVLSRAGVALPLSVDHKPDRPDECERIEAAGGKVINWNGHRIFGVIATSRSLGDEYLKPFVISKPDVTVTKRSELDEFLILASDGLWDVLSNEEACQIARRCLNGRMRRKSQEVMTQNGAAEAAAVLTELSMARGSGDNISVIVVDLRKPVNFS